MLHDVEHSLELLHNTDVLSVQHQPPELLLPYICALLPATLKQLPSLYVLHIFELHLSSGVQFSCVVE
jgi:hypothetical protein